MPLSEADRIRMLEELAEDGELKATQRLRALEELGRIHARKAGAVQEEVPSDLAPDPMRDLDEVEQARQRKARRGLSRGRATR